jgi:hypothetical protein
VSTRQSVAQQGRVGSGHRKQDNTGQEKARGTLQFSELPRHAKRLSKFFVEEDYT